MKLRVFPFPRTSAFVLLIAPFLPAQTPTSPPAPAPASATPLLANLTVPLDISRTKVGTHIQARVFNPWSANGCTLQKGALVEGHVSQVHPRTKTEKTSAFALVIDSAECDRHRGTPLKVVVYALIGPPGTSAPNGESGMGKAPGLTDIPVNGYSGGGTAAPDVAPAQSGFRSVEGASAVNQYAIPGRTLPAQWHAGMVIDAPMNLSVGTGAEGGSIVWATKTDARLEAQTTLILIATPQP